MLGAEDLSRDIIHVERLNRFNQSITEA